MNPLPRVILSLPLLAAVALGQSSAAAPPAGSPIYDKAFASLSLLFVMAVVLESAFSVIFSWRVFLTYFSLGGVKTLVMVAVSYLVVKIFGLDLLTDLIRAYGNSKVEMNQFTQFITALVLAGGSTGINNILLSLGFRSLKQDPANARPPQNKAWVAVRVNRVNSTGPVQVTITDIAPIPDPLPPTLAGIAGMRRPRLWELLLGSPNRFPSSGGHTVEPGKPYLLAASALSKQDPNTTVTQTIGKYVFAPGAIVDFEVDL